VQGDIGVRDAPGLEVGDGLLDDIANRVDLFVDVFLPVPEVAVDGLPDVVAATLRSPSSLRPAQSTSSVARRPATDSSRGGDRALNKAIHLIATIRTRTTPRPRSTSYAGGESDREIRRCIKRYIARQLFRAPTAAMTSATAAST
jgi:hypothetical protein